VPGAVGSTPHDRLFIAAAIPARQLAACRELISAVAGSPSVTAAGGRVRWTRPENLHLTLRFLGATDRSLIPAIEAAMRLAAVALPSFPLVLAGTGTFPVKGPPRALWLDVARGREELTALVRSLDARLDEIGIAPGTGPFRPHLTVARAARGDQAAARVAAAALRDAAAGWTAAFEVTRIQLFRSELGSGPPRYEELASIALLA
jgi:RNA 2',3'-cyclic 3'-phosphodiesterase